MSTVASLAASNLLRLQWLLRANDVQRKLARFVEEAKAGFNSDQPRVPSGNSDGGQWTGDGGAAGGDSQSSDIGSQRREPGKRPPSIPDGKPVNAKERNRVIKEVARWLPKVGGKLGAVGKVGSWIYEAGATIASYQDSPKSLGELRDAALAPTPGYDIHHIVEKTPAAQDGFSASQIEAAENLVRIPRLSHWEITGWYMTPNEDYNFATPRDYLRGKSWEERQRVGLESLVNAGVLEP